MRRFLLNVIAEDGIDVDLAMVAVGRDTALKWLRAKEVYREADKQLDNSLFWLMLANDDAGFFQGWPEDVGDLVDRLSDEGWVEIPDGIEADFSIPPELAVDLTTMKVGETGVSWESFPRHGDGLISTAPLPWEAIREIADEAEPTNNRGRGRCWWCGEATRKVPLFTGVTEECPHCGK